MKEQGANSATLVSQMFPDKDGVQDEKRPKAFFQVAIDVPGFGRSEAAQIEGFLSVKVSVARFTACVGTCQYGVTRPRLVTYGTRGIVPVWCQFLSEVIRSLAKQHAYAIVAVSLKLPILLASSVKSMPWLTDVIPDLAPWLGPPWTCGRSINRAPRQCWPRCFRSRH